MAILEIENLQPFDSPVKRLIGDVALSPLLVAHCRRGELEDLISKFDAKIRLDYTGRAFRLEAAKTFPRVYVGVATLERLWALSFAYYTFLELIRSSPKGALVSIGEHPRGGEAFELLKWAMAEELSRNMVSEEPEPFPTGLPLPGDPTDSQAVLADEIFQCATGWMLLHELAHLALDHDFSEECPEARLIEQEWEADKWASGMVFPAGMRTDFDDGFFVKRALGVAIGLSSLTGIEIHPKGRLPKDHPRSIDRLIAFLDQSIGEEDPESASRRELPWFAAAAIVSAQLSLFDMGGAVGEFSDFRTLLLRAKDLTEPKH